MVRPKPDQPDPFRRHCWGERWWLCEADGSELATVGFPRTPQLPPSSSKPFHAVKTFFFFAASQLKAKKLETFSERRPVSCTVVTWRAWFHALPAKSSKRFLSRSTRPVDWRCSRCNSPDEALHAGESGVSLGRPVPEKSEITSTYTRNTSIIIIEGHWSAKGGALMSRLWKDTGSDRYMELRD